MWIFSGIAHRHAVCASDNPPVVSAHEDVALS